MGINFNDRVLVTNPTSFFIGRGVLVVGIVAIALGLITHFAGDFVFPADLWIALGIPTAVAGWVVRKAGLTKN